MDAGSVFILTREQVASAFAVQRLLEEVNPRLFNGLYEAAGG